MSEEKASLKNKLAKLLKNIEQNKYSSKELDDLDELGIKLTKDIGYGVDIDQAMALLGYLIKQDYVIIDPDAGIILNEQNNEINEIRKMI